MWFKVRLEVEIHLGREVGTRARTVTSDAIEKKERLPKAFGQNGALGVWVEAQHYHCEL